MSYRFAVSDTCQAFRDIAVGSKVEDTDRFLANLADGLKYHNKANDRTPGQHYIVLPDVANETVTAGDGRVTQEPGDYHVRLWRGKPHVFLRRHRAGKVRYLAVIVYTMEAFKADPDVVGKQLTMACQPVVLTVENWQELDQHTHVIVAVIACSGPAAPLTPSAFVHNLAGGNKDWPAPDETHHEHRAELYARAVEQAKSIDKYWKEWAVVAD